MTHAEAVALCAEQQRVPGRYALECVCVGGGVCVLRASGVLTLISVLLLKSIQSYFQRDSPSRLRAPPPLSPLSTLRIAN